MSKLTTTVIKKFITDPENLQWYLAMFSPDDRAVIWEEMMDVRNWKREYKIHFKSLGPKVYLESDASIDEIVETLETFTDEEPVIFDPAELTSDCVVRHMVTIDYSLDCYVISDPSDTRILRLYWNQD